MSIFEKATRADVKFDSSKGLLQVQDLWDLPLTSTTGKPNLDDIARGLRRELKASDDESFVTKPAKANDLLQLKFDVVKHIIDVRLVEAEAASTAKANSDKKQSILAIINQKENEQLAGSSLEDLKALAASL